VTIWTLLVVVAIVAAVAGLFKQLRTAGVLQVLQSVRTRPRLRIIVAAELALVMLAAAMVVYTHRWAVVAWEIAGLCFAGLLLITVRSIHTRPAPRPAPLRVTEPIPAGAESTRRTDDKPGPASVRAGPPPRAIDCVAVPELGGPIPEEPEKRRLICMHAVGRDEKVPRPSAVCGYEYDHTAIATAGPWGLMPAWSMCPKCIKALRGL
jgi:hypothetical protein